MSLLTAAERKLLTALLGTDAAVSGRALARMTELSQPTAQRALVRLRESGLVMTENAPPALLYRANRDHVAMPAVSDLLDLTDRLRQRAGQELAAWVIPPSSAVLYGSVARGDAGPASDVDVLVVRPDLVSSDDDAWAEQVASLSTSMTRWTGRPASVVELSESEARRGLTRGEGFVVAAAAEGLLISGRPLISLRTRAKR